MVQPMASAQLTNSNLTHQSRPEEVVNTITHGLGVPLSIAALVVMIVKAAPLSAWHVVGVSIFGTSLVSLYLASCIYHAVCIKAPQRLFQVLDHVFIFVLIAGSYTPWVLVNLRGPWGWTLFGMVWGIAVVGIVIKAILLPRYQKLGSALYIAMGWLVCIAFDQIVASVPPIGIMWLVAGGLCYTMGVIFFISSRPFAHAIWHVFVLAGSTCHFFAVLSGVIVSR